MVLTEVLTEARTLSRAEQFRLIQELAAALLQDESRPRIEPGREYAVWSPDAAFGAADILLQSLNDHAKQT